MPAVPIQKVVPEVQRNTGMNGEIFGSFGYVSRIVSCVSGGIILGSNYGWLPGVAGGLFGMAVFLLAEKSYRR